VVPETRKRALHFKRGKRFGGLGGFPGVGVCVVWGGVVLFWWFFFWGGGLGVWGVLKGPLKP